MRGLYTICRVYIVLPGGSGMTCNDLGHAPSVGPILHRSRTTNHNDRHTEDVDDVQTIN